MAHYAFIDPATSTVVEVIVGRNEGERGLDGPAWERHYEEFRPGMICRQCSYNTRHGVHLRGGVPLRGNYPGIGFTYDESLDAFLPPRPESDGWVVDRETYQWVKNTD